MAKLYYAQDCNFHALDGKTIAVILPDDGARYLSTGLF